MPSDIYKAFKLKPLKEVSTLPVESSTEDKPLASDEKQIRPINPTIEKKIPKIPPQTKNLLDDVDNWHNGDVLSQTSANTLRNIIKTFVNMRIDWDKLMIHPINIDVQKFFIERATGNHAATIKLGSYKNSRVTLFFKSAINISWCRNGKHGPFNCTCPKHKNIDKKDFMEDYIRVINFIDEIIPQVEDQILKDIDDNLISVTKLLERHSKILGLTNNKQAKKSKVLENILNQIDENFEFDVDNPQQYDDIPALKNWIEIKLFAVENKKNTKKLLMIFLLQARWEQDTENTTKHQQS